MMKKMLALGATFSCAMMLVGCGNNAAEGTEDGNAEAGEEQVEFTFSWWGGDARHTATQEIIDIYMEENPHVTITPQFGAWSGWQDQITMQLAGNTEADLMQVNFNWLQLFSPNGDRFLDLETVADYIDLNNYDSDVLDTMRRNEVLQAIPAGMTARVPFLNASIYERAGIGLDELPSTWDELMEAGRTIQAELGDDYFALSKLGNAAASYLMFSYLEQLTGEPFLTEDGELNYTVEQLEAGFQLIYDFIENGVMPHGTVDSDDMNENNQRWIEGRYGGINEWDSTITRWLDTVADDTEIVTVPHFTMDDAKLSGIISRPSMGFVISPNSEHPEEVASFLNFMLTDERAIELMGLDRGIPANEVGFNTLVELGLLEGLAVEAHDLHMNADTTTMHPLFEHPEGRLVYEGALEEVTFGRLTPREAAERVVSQLPPILADAMAEVQ